MIARPSHNEGGKLVTQWFHGITPVYGGWVVRRCRWELKAEGWDLDEELLATPEILFKTREEAVAASGGILNGV